MMTERRSYFISILGTKLLFRLKKQKLFSNTTPHFHIIRARPFRTARFVCIKHKDRGLHVCINA